MFGCAAGVFLIEKFRSRQGTPVMCPSRTEASYTANNTSIDKPDLVKKVVFPSLPTDALKQWKQRTCLTAAQLTGEKPIVSPTIIRTAINCFRSL